MKRTIPFAALLLLTSIANAQSWCPPEAEWTYTSWGFSFQGYTSFTYVGDTVIDGTSSQKLDARLVAYDFALGQNIDNQYADYFTNLSGDLVSIWNGVEFDTLYWFGAAPGQGWKLTLDPGIGLPDDFDILVQDSGTALVDGLPLHWLKVLHSQLGPDTIYERMGGLLQFMVPWEALFVDGNSGPLRCYHDVAIDHVVPSWNEACDFVLGVDEPTALSNTAIFPNPGTDHFTLKAPGHHGILEVLDATGRRILVRELRDGSALIDASAWDPGLYLLRMEGSLDPLRWMKE